MTSELHLLGARIGLAVQGRLDQAMQQELHAAEKAVTVSIRRVASGLKNEMRRQVKRAGMGEGLARAWRSRSYPHRGFSLDAKGVVWGAAKYLHVFETGATIRAQGAKWLAIPTAHVGRLGNRRLKVKDFRSARLQFLPTRDPNVARLVHRAGMQDTLLFWLVKQVHVKKTLDFRGASEKWLDKLPGYIVTAWNRAADPATTR